jgi:tetratricopeptide (TPR) repeat protein
MKAGLLGSLVGMGTLSAFTVSVGVASAGNFNNVQQVYAPPSVITRRYDLDSAGQTNWGTDINGNPIGTPGAQPNPVYAGSAVMNKSAKDSGLGLAFGNDSKTLAKLIKQGKWDDAEKLARRLEKVNPKDAALKASLVQILVAKANIFYNATDYDNAGKKAREALSYDFPNSSARTVLGQVIGKQGLNPKLAKDHLKIADSLAAQSRFVEGAVEYRLALSITPSAAGHVGLGNIAVSHGRIDDGKLEYTRALQVDSKSSIAYRQLGSLKYAVHDLVGANQDLSKAVTLNSQDELAKAALIELWRRQVMQNPKDVNAHLGLARAYLQTGDLDSAKAEYQQVAALDPQNAHLPAARKAFRIALARQESRKCYQAAVTLNGQGASSDAHQKLLEALSYAPGSPDVLLLNGQVCEKLGLFTEAHDAYMSVLKEDPLNVVAAQRLKALPAASGTSASLSNTAPTRSSSQASAPQPAPNINSSNNPSASSSTPPNSSSALPAAAPDAVAKGNSDSIGKSSPTLVAEAPIVDPTPTQSTQTNFPIQSLGQPQTATQQLPADYPNSLLAPATQMPSLSGDVEESQDTSGTSAHTSALGGFMSSLRSFSTAHQQAFQNFESGTQSALQNAGLLPGGNSNNNSNSSPSYNGYSVYSGYPVYNGYPGYGYPTYAGQGGGMPVASMNSNVLANPMQGTAIASMNVSNSPSAASSLMQFLATPLASKMGFQPVGQTNSNQPPQVATMTVNQIVVGSNGAAYMVPMAVPVNLPSSSNSSGNQVSSGLAQKLHLGSVVNANQTLSNLLSGNQSANSSQGNMQAVPLAIGPSGTLVAIQPAGQAAAASAQPSTPQAPSNPPAAAQAAAPAAPQAPLIAVSDWNTSANSSAADDPLLKPATETPVGTTPSSEANWSIATGPNSLVALKPAVATAANSGASPTVALQITQVKSTMGGVKVKVVLKNSGTTDIRIPDGQKIAINSTSNGLHMLDVSFGASIIPAGGQVTGTAKLPTKKIDSSTDVFLPSFYNDGTKLTDLHVSSAM